MKTALIITGQLRTFDKCLPTIKWHVIRRFSDVRLFISTVDDDDFKRMNNPEGDWTIEAVRSAPQFNHPNSDVFSAFWTLFQGWQLYLKSTPEDKLAELVIHCRPNLMFQSFDLPRFPLTSSGNERKINSKMCFVPWWGKGGGCNPQFAV